MLVMVDMVLFVCIPLPKDSLGALFEAIHRTLPSAMATLVELVMLEAAPRAFLILGCAQDLAYLTTFYFCPPILFTFAVMP